MTASEEIRQALINGEKPYPLTKRYSRGQVYSIYNLMVAKGELSQYGGVIPDPVDNTHVDNPSDTDEDDGSDQSGTQQKVKLPYTVKRAAASASGKTADVINFAGQNLPANAVSAVRGALGMAVVPSVLRMPMPELLYTAMVVSISEMGWPSLQPQDFIDSVLYQWLDACDFIVRPIQKKSELQAILDKSNAIDENSPALKKYVAEHKLMTWEQAQEIFKNSQTIQANSNIDGNGNNGNGHNGNGHEQIMEEKTIPNTEVKHEVNIQQVKPIIQEKPVTQPMQSVQTRKITPIQSLTKPKITEETIIANVPDVLQWMVIRLRDNGILTIGQLITRSESDLVCMTGLGNAMSRKIKEWVEELGFKLKELTPVKDSIPAIVDNLIKSGSDLTVSELTKSLDQISSVKDGAKDGNSTDNTVNK
jgi:hypothetical protein